MNREYRALSVVREASPFATPPRVLVVADDHDIREAVELRDRLEEIGADAEVRFFADASRDHSHPDAVIVADSHGYHVTRHHPVLEGILRARR